MADIIDEIQVDFDAIADRATRQVFKIAEMRAENARLRRELKEAKAALKEAKGLIFQMEYDPFSSTDFESE